MKVDSLGLPSRRCWLAALAMAAAAAIIAAMAIEPAVARTAFLQAGAVTPIVAQAPGRSNDNTARQPTCSAS